MHNFLSLMAVNGWSWLLGGCEEPPGAIDIRVTMIPARSSKDGICT
jgi:hypothetical protein